MKRLLMLLAIATIASWTVAQAQEPPPKPSETPRRSVNTKQLLLEIFDQANQKPAYLTIGGPESDPKWMWMGRFVRIPGRELAPGELPVRAVRFEARFNGQTADVKVTLLRGVQTFEKEELVNTYQIALGEEKTISELANFGIKPFEIKLIEAVPTIPPSPAFNNLTQSVEVVRVESHNLPRPAYSVTFRNLSDKSVTALHVQVTIDGRPGMSTMFQGQDNRALIEPGGVSEQYLSVMTAERTATTYVPGTASSNIINIHTAIFSDFSVEGDLGPACMFERMVMGRRVWLRNVIALLDQEIAKSNSDQTEAAKQFKEKLSALTYNVNESEQNQASAVSPTCSKPSEGVVVTTQILKLDLLRDLDRVSPVNFKSWLVERRARYQAWLSRL